jgi:hypothetical protein
MKPRMTWPELCRSEQFRGLWVALDNCRYDPSTRQPVEGDVVDVDEDFAELCSRMRETGCCSCAVVFCDQDVFVEEPRPSQRRAPLRSQAPS